MIIRQAVLDDAPEISIFLQELTAIGKRASPDDQEFIRSFYIEHSDNVHCIVAEDTDGTILGIQILKTACEGNQYGVTPGWGIIGTHIRPSAARRGVGKALFAVTREAAKSAGLNKIDASIANTNEAGLAYYEAIGFQTYRTPNNTICKCYMLG